MSTTEGQKRKKREREFMRMGEGGNGTPEAKT